MHSKLALGLNILVVLVFCVLVNLCFTGAQNTTSCHSNKDCSSDLKCSRRCERCSGRCTQCIEENNFCRRSSDCCTGTVCHRRGFCQRCSQRRERCEVDRDCCSRRCRRHRCR
ncbi:unnamed protein product [Dicrocoelium dendriticum]|nr:unnamed protein product [Dicrocoelium dendriticum]